MNEAQYRAQKKYAEKMHYQMSLKLNKKTDADVIAKLETVPSKLWYIKELIRKDIKRG